MGVEIVKVYRDQGISGAERPAFDDLCKAVTRREINLVMAWSTDRLGRSLQDLVNFLSELKAAGADLFLYKQALDTSTSSGRAMWGMLSTFAEFERDIITERVHAGIARARPQGKTFRVSASIEKRIRTSLKAGTGILKTARTVGVGTATVQRVKAEMAN